LQARAAIRRQAGHADGCGRSASRTG